MTSKQRPSSEHCRETWYKDEANGLNVKDFLEPSEESPLEYELNVLIHR